MCVCGGGGDSSKTTHAGHTPLRLRTHFSSRFFRRVASIRSRSGGMRGRARRANRRSICKMGQTDTQIDRQTETDRQTLLLVWYLYMYMCTSLCMHHTIESLMSTESRFGTLSAHIPPSLHAALSFSLGQGLTSMPSNSILITGTKASGTNCRGDVVAKHNHNNIH